MKTIVLGVIYGKGLFALSRDMKMDIDAARVSLNQFAAFMPELGVPTYEKIGQHWRAQEPTVRTYKDEALEMLRHSGETTNLFGRKRRFAGLYHLRRCQRCKIYTSQSGREYEWDVAPIQLWNYTLHSHVYQVKNVKTGTVIGTSTWRLPVDILHRPSLTAWPFHQISYRAIRRIQVGSDLVHFTPIEKCERMGFNAIIQSTAGDVFKQAILNVQPVMHQFSARMIFNVHDELVFTVPTANVHPFVAALETAMTLPPAPWWTIPIAVDIEIGQNYGQLHTYSLN